MPEWASLLVAKAKVAGLLGAALAAGGAGGMVALSHVTPVSEQVVTSAASTSSPDTEAADAQTADPESDDAQTPDPETTEAQDPAPADCPADVKNHGAYVSSVARSAAHGKDGDHGKAVSAGAKSDCGKDKTDKADGADDPESVDAESGDQKSGEPKGSATPKSGHADVKPSHVPPAKSQGHAHAHQH